MADLASEGSESTVSTTNWIFVIVSALLNLVGLVVSLYLVKHHLLVKFQGGTEAFCNINSYVNCDAVARSRYAEFLGIPLGVYGAGFFLGQLALLGVSSKLPQYARSAWQAFSVMAAAGVAAAILLGALQAFVVKAFCVACFSTYLASLLQGGLLLVYKNSIPRPFELRTIYNGLVYPFTAFALVLLLFQVFKPTSRDFKQDLPQTKEFLNQLATQQEQQKAEIKVDLTPYSGLGEDYRKGGDEAKVKLVEFTDFQCPACRSASKLMKQLHEEFGNKILIVFKNYPLDKSCNSKITSDFHKYSCQAALLARCAGRYGKFWEFHDLVFENQEQMDEERLKGWADGVGLDPKAIQGCFDSKDLKQKIREDIDLGNALGVEGTPTLFLNGQRISSPGAYEELRRHIIRQLER